MKIMIMAINYHADEQLISLLYSLVKTSNFKQHKIEVNVLDNSQRSKENIIELKNKLQDIYKYTNVYSDGTNSGYFGGIKLAQKLIDDTFDAIIYCNPDIKLEFNFLDNLDIVNKNKSASIIAPAIISTSDGFDQNPKYLKRLTIEKLNKLKKIYSNLVVYCIYQFLARIKEMILEKKSKKQEKYKQKDIYAPHGAIFIFTNIDFFKSLPVYEPFLFGEEIFIAEEAKKQNRKIIYYPDVIVYDERHASISLLGCDKIRGYYYESIEYLLQRYYN